MNEIVNEILDREERLWAANREGDGLFYRAALTDDALARHQQTPLG
ncbi:hypothetical protein ACQPZX_33955 [Actinoplanes sp. CA-142083]